MVASKAKMINIKELWSLRSHLKLEAACFFLMLPGFLSMITVPVFELEKVNFEIFYNDITIPITVLKYLYFSNNL